jgi:hypothetical protein
MYSTLQKNARKRWKTWLGAYAPRFVDWSRALTLPTRLRLGSQAVNVDSFAESSVENFWRLAAVVKQL